MKLDALLSLGRLLDVPAARTDVLIMLTTARVTILRVTAHGGDHLAAHLQAPMLGLVATGISTQYLLTEPDSLYTELSQCDTHELCL